jgi:hypothetical protein
MCNPTHSPSKGSNPQNWEQVKPGGSLVFDHYSNHWSWYLKLRRCFEHGCAACQRERAWCGRSGWWILSFRYTARAAVRDWARNYSGASLRFAATTSCFQNLRMSCSDSGALLDTHDALTDWYKHRYTRGQLRRVLEDLGAKGIWCESGGNGVEARCVRPVVAAR